MRLRSIRVWGAALVALLALGWGLAEAVAQQRRTSRRVTNPVRPRATPTPPLDASEPALVSTADEEQEPATRRTGRGGATPAPTPAPDPLRSTVEQLSTQVERLSEDVNSMRSDQRALFDLERLTRAEQRAESLRAQLRDVSDKEFSYQERLSQIEDELRPDSIQRRAAIVGTLNPGTVRDQIQRSLERERDRIRRQLEMVTNSRARLEAAVTSAETEVERLRQRVEANEQPQTNAAAPVPTPSPAPTPAETPTPAEPPTE